MSDNNEEFDNDEVEDKDQPVPRRTVIFDILFAIVLLLIVGNLGFAGYVFYYYKVGVPAEIDKKVEEHTARATYALSASMGGIIKDSIVGAYINNGGNMSDMFIEDMLANSKIENHFRISTTEDIRNKMFAQLKANYQNMAFLTKFSEDSVVIDGEKFHYEVIYVKNKTEEQQSVLEQVENITGDNKSQLDGRVLTANGENVTSAFTKDSLVLDDADSVIKANSDNNTTNATTNNTTIIMDLEPKIQILELQNKTKLEVNKTEIALEQEELLKRLPNARIYSNGQSAKIGIIVDDCGYNLDIAKQAVNIQYPLTLAILPYLRYSKEVNLYARSHGKPTFLHAPMEAVNYPQANPGDHPLLVNLPNDEIRRRVNMAVESVGQIDGFNNHQGSKFTQDKEKMSVVLTEMKKYANVFVDSHTIASTQGYNVCNTIDNYSCGIARRFIDNEPTASSMFGELIFLANVANKEQDGAIGITHCRSHSVDYLPFGLDMLVRKGFNIVNVTEITK